MLREKAFDFWKTYIGLMTKGGVDVSMTNPAVTFTADAKAGEYDDISDEEYYELLDFTEELASFWKKNREATAGAVLLEALVNTDLSLSETDKLAQLLAEASERKTYKYIKPEPEFETIFDKTPFDEGEVEWTPQMIYEYLDENVYRQENAKKAAKDVIDLGIYHLYGEGQQWATPDEAVANYVNIFLCHNSDEDIMLQYYDLVNHNSDDFQLPRVGLFNSPNGFHGWGGNTPTGQLVDSYEMSDGTKFSWSNPAQAIHPYENRDPRFYACILYDGAHWRERPDDTVDADPDGIVQTGFYQQADGSYTAGLDTRQGPIEDWNGTYTGYYMRKFLDPSVNHQYDKQLFPWRQIRYAEVLLNYAEACLELGEEEEARKYINMIRKRAGMPDIPSTETGKELMGHYRNERKIELAYEQHRYFDIRRWMIAPEVIQPAQGIDIRYPYGSQDPVYSVIEVQERKWNNKAYFLPIYLDEINKNDLLIQNPGY